MRRVKFGVIEIMVLTRNDNGSIVKGTCWRLGFANWRVFLKWSMMLMTSRSSEYSILGCRNLLGIMQIHTVEKNVHNAAFQRKSGPVIALTGFN
jgi:hypothetical protein